MTCDPERRLHFRPPNMPRMKGEILLEAVLNYLFFRFTRAGKAGKRFLKSLDSEITEEFLQLLLNAMSLVFKVDKTFRKNIENFNGRYLFKSRDNRITVSVIFENNEMKIWEGRIADPHMTVDFKNSKALRDYLLSPRPDILGSLLRQDVVPDGNLNYLYKFAFMAKRLQLKALGKI